MLRKAAVLGRGPPGIASRKPYGYYIDIYSNVNYYLNNDHSIRF